MMINTTRAVLLHLSFTQLAVDCGGRALQYDDVTPCIETLQETKGKEAYSGGCSASLHHVLDTTDFSGRNLSMGFTSPLK